MLTRVLLFCAAVVFGAAAFGLVPNPLLTVSSGFNGEVATGMAAVYGSLRILKGVLMMAADANFSGGLAVVSFEGSPGQLVTPVIDTVERMANLTFALLIVAGVLAVLLPILGNWAAGLVAVGALVLMLVGWSGGRLPRGIAAGARALVFLGLFGAIVLPGAYALASLIGDSYLPTATHTSELQEIVAPMAESENAVVAPPTAETTTGPAAEQSFWDYVAGQIGGLVQSVGQAGESFAGAAAGTLEQVQMALGSVGHAIEQAQQLLQLLISLAVAYILKLFVLPMVVIGGTLLVARMAWRGARPAPVVAA